VLCAIWQGKGVLAAIGIPFLFTYLVQLYSKEYTRANLVPVIAISVGICSFTLMSAFFVTSIQLLMWVVVSIRNRKVAHIGYLFAGLVGPVFQILLLGFIYRLMLDMKGLGPRFFKSRFK
jgi:DMSO/TMAO reductase YedYZ heme-binding membrane subunit